MVYEAIAAKQDVQTGPVIFTYDVLWRASNVKWASRWDIYLSMDNAVPDKVRSPVLRSLRQPSLHPSTTRGHRDGGGWFLFRF